MSDNVPVASRPTERELDLELVKLVDWQVFATHLPGLERENIEEIQRNNHEVHLQKLELFGTWLRIHPDASWKDVVLALENARENTLAEAVKKRFKISIPVQDTASTLRVYETQQIQHTSNEKVFLPIAVDEVQKTNDSTELCKVEEKKVEVNIDTADEIATQLVGLHKRFALLETNIKDSLDGAITKDQITLKHIARYLHRHLEDKQLKLTDAKDIDDLFDKLESHYSFLNCELLEEIVNQFLEDKIQAEVEKYVKDVEAFETLTTLQELKDAIEQALVPTQSVTPFTCEVILKVSRRWKKEKMRCLNKLLEHIFSKKRYLLNHIKLEDGSLCIRFLVPKSQVEMLIALATKHMEFMYLFGVFEMMINDIPVLMKDENENFTFDSALLESSQFGNNEAVQFLLDLGVNINYSNSEGKTALMLACQAGHEEVVQALVSGGANINLQDSTEETALILASGNIGVIHCLLLAKADLDIQRQDGNTALHIACYKGHNTVIELLLSYHASPVIKNSKDDTPFMASVRGNNADILQLMIDAIPSSHLSSGIVLACRLGHSAVFSLLVKQLECTPQVIDLFISCAEGDVGSVIQHIMEFNIDPNTTLISGITPLMIASSCGHVEVIDTLVQMKADINRIDSDNYSPLAYAITGNKSLPTVQYLLEAGANPHILLGGITILERAYRKEGQQDICDILFKFSALDLQKRFTHLLDRIEEGFDHLIAKEKDILLNFSQFLKVYPEITGSSKVHDSTDLFSRVRAYSDFLSYELLVVITKEFLKYNVEIQEELEEYLSIVQTFEELLKIENVMAFLPQQEETTMATSTYLVFKLNRNWSNKTLKMLHKFYSFLFSDNQRYLSHMTVDIVEMVPCIKFLIPNSKQIIEDLVSEVAKKRELMYPLGVFEVIINNTPVLIEDEDKNFTFESAIQKAAQFGNNEAVQLLLDLSNVDHTHNESKPFPVASDPRHLSVDITSLLNNPNALDDETGYPKLIHASGNGMYQMVEMLLKQGANPNIQNENGETALIFASSNGHYQVVHILLEKLADPNIHDKYGGTALIVGSEKGHQQVVELLLEKQVDLDVQNRKNGATALIQASQNGHYQVVEILLKKGANPNIQNENGETALIFASSNGHYQVVHILLEKLADPNIHDKYGGTALIVGSEKGHQQVVELLLEKQVDPNVRDNKCGTTALLQASCNGHYQVVEVLLKHGADPNIHAGNEEVTALLFASQKGYYKVVDILLKKGADPNIHDKYGRTALIVASQFGHQQVVELLLEKQVDLDVQNGINGRTALFQASWNGHYQVVEILLKKGADPNIHDNDGGTTLILATENGHQQIVELLLEQEVDPNVQNSKNGRTALIQAIQNGHYQLVEILLKNGADPNIQEVNGYTALLCASSNGHYQVVEILLKNGADPDIQASKDEVTALLFASQKGYYQVVDILLKKLADPNIRDKYGRTALIVASWFGHQQIVELLLEKQVDLNAQNSINGRTALFQASWNGHYQVVEILLKKGADPNIHDNTGWTALILASGKGHQQVVELLLETHVDPNVQNSKNGATALIQASQNGHYQVVEVLIKKGADPNIHDNTGWTALILASGKGHQQIVELLLETHVDLNVQNSKNGATALIQANGNIGIVSCLLLAKADPDLQRKDGNTALHIACYRGHYTVIELLLSYHASPVIKNTKDDTPFMASVRGNNADILKLMIDAIPSSHLSSGIVLACRLGHSAVFSLLVKQLECTPQVIDLFISCAEGDVESVIQHIMELNIDPNTTLISGITPLMIASSCGHVEVIDTLIQMEADVNRIDTDNYSPLAYAITGNKSLPTVQYLLEAGANPHVLLGDITILERAHREEAQQDICDILFKFSALDLQKRFTHLLDRIEEGFDHLIAKEEDILLNFSQFLEVYPEITGSSKVHDSTDLFSRVRAYSDFLSYELLVVITREFLKYNVEIQEELEEYLSIVQTFEELLKIENVMAFLPQQEETTMATSTYLVFKLNRLWSNKTLKHIRSLCSFLFSDNTRYLSHMTVGIIEKVPCIKFLIPNSIQIIEDFISEVAKKRVLMYLLGVFEMMINKTPILAEDEEKNFTFESALQIAVQFFNNEAVQLLLGLSNVDRTHNETKAFPIASDPGHLSVDITSLLNKISINPNALYDETGYPILIHASRNGMYQMVEMLLKLGADPNIQNENGETALIFASSNGHYPVVKILHQKGADPNIHDNNGWTALILSSENGHQQIVELLLEKQVDPNVQNSKNGRTALIQASQNGHYQVIVILLKKGADPNIHDNDGWTALILSSENGHQQIVELLLEKQVDPNVQNSKNGRTALIQASSNGHYQVVEILLVKGADPNIQDEDGWTALSVASLNGHYPVVKILHQNGASPNFHDNNGWTALIIAAQNGHQQVVELLLEKQVDPNVQNSKNGRTALIQASQNGHYQVIVILLKKGADPNIHDNDGWTALILSSENGHQQIVELLLEKQVDPNVQNSKNGRTALIQASSNGHYQVVEILLVKGADPNIQDEDGWTALSVASLNGHYPMVKILHQNGASPNFHDNNGWTALIIAAQNGHQQVVELLLERQVDPNVQNSKNGITALIQASSNGHYQVVEVLLKNGADPNIHNNNGFTALIFASQNGHYQVVEILLKNGADPDIRAGIDEVTALLFASQKGYYQIVDILLKNGADPNIHDNDGRTTLIIASEIGHQQVVELLLEKQVDPNVRNSKNGRTALYMASQNGHYQVVEVLLKNGADPNIHDNHGRTTLIVASEIGHQQVVELLLEKQIDPNVRNSKNGRTALYMASWNGHYQVVDKLLKKGADPNIHDKEGFTALMFASVLGHSDIVEVLLRYNANPHYSITTSEGISIDSFICAAMSGNIECVNIFLKHNELSLKSLSMGWYSACNRGHVPIIRLLSNRLDIVSDQTDLIIFCAEGDLGSAVDQLMSGMITPDVQFVHGVTPLMISSSCGHIDIVEALITAGANVNNIDELGQTALDFAEAAQQDATKDILLQHGGIKGSGPESESESDMTTSEEQKLSTDTSQSTIKLSQNSLSIKKKELNTKNRPLKYSQSIFSPYQRFDNRKYSTTHIP